MTKSTLMKTAAFLFCAFLLTSAAAADKTSYFLIGNSLTWDTVPSRLDGDTQWHVDCGKSLPFIRDNPDAPCVKTSTLWPTALSEKQFDIVSLQTHYGATLAQDIQAISAFVEMQPKAKIVIHTGWARSAERTEEWSSKDRTRDTKMNHSLAYVGALVNSLKKKYPQREFTRTRAMDTLQIVSEDIANGKAPIKEVGELYRDKIHMNIVTGRYLMHNAMRHALGQPRSAVGFEKLTPEMKSYLDSVLDRVHH